MPPPVLATWIYAEPEGDESHYPQVVGQGAPSSARFQAVYWRCVGVFFASAARWAPEARLVLYTNTPSVPRVDGVDLGAALEGWHVEVVPLAYTFRPPGGYFGAWRNQFYVLDALRDLARRVEGDGVGMLLDSDCVWAQPIGPMAEAARSHGALTYDLELGPDEVQNGLTPRQMGALYAEVAPTVGADVLRAPAPYVGGELVAATGDVLGRMDDLFDPLWAEMLRRHEAGLSRFNEEAHALSFVYHVLGLEVGTAAPYLRRIWTTLTKGDDARPSDLDLTVWHVPAEKRYGLRRLFPGAVSGTGPFWTLEGRAWRAWVGARLGLPRRPWWKWGLDVPAAVLDKVRARLA